MGLEINDNNNDYLRQIEQREEAASKFVEESVRQFESGFDFFIAGETNQVILFKGDFKQPHEGFLFEREDYETEFLAGRDNSVTVRYNILRARFLEIIRDLVKDTNASTDFVLPNQVTDGLKRFIGKNPRLRTRVTSLTYDFGDFEGEGEKVVAQRFLNPLNVQPISEVWYAQRNYEVLGNPSGNGIRYVVVPRSYGLL